MNIERIQLKGQLAEAKSKYKHLDTEDLAYRLRTEFENKTVFIPKSHEIREDLHSVRRITTVSHNIRFDADHSENGHADRFWALALALHAADNGSGQINISTRKRYETLKLVEE